MRTEKEITEDYLELLDIVLRCNGSGQDRPGLCTECKSLIAGLQERAKREHYPKPKPGSPSLTHIPGLAGLTIKRSYYQNFPENERRVLVLEFDTPTNTSVSWGPEALVLDKVKL